MVGWMDGWMVGWMDGWLGFYGILRTQSVAGINIAKETFKSCIEILVNDIKIYTVDQYMFYS